MPSPIALLKHADRIAWHSFAALLFIASGVALDTVMCAFPDFANWIAIKRTYVDGPFGTLVIARMPCGMYGAIVAPAPIDFPDVRATGACFTPSPQARVLKGEAVPDAAFSAASTDIISGTASGWPMCCFEGFRIVHLNNNSATVTTTNVSVLTFDDSGRLFARWAIPTHPRWFPLAVNFIVGVGVSILLSNFAQARRRSRRLRRGLCPTCAYNRASLAPAAPCPECGAAPSL